MDGSRFWKVCVALFLIILTTMNLSCSSERRISTYSEPDQPIYCMVDKEFTIALDTIGLEPGGVWSPRYNANILRVIDRRVELPIEAELAAETEPTTGEVIYFDFLPLTIGETEITFTYIHQVQEPFAYVAAGEVLEMPHEEIAPKVFKIYIESESTLVIK